MWHRFLLSSQYRTVTSKQSNTFCNHSAFPTSSYSSSPSPSSSIPQNTPSSTECYCRRLRLRTFISHEIAHPTSVNGCSAVSVTHGSTLCNPRANDAWLALGISSRLSLIVLRTSSQVSKIETLFVSSPSSLMAPIWGGYSAFLSFFVTADDLLLGGVLLLTVASLDHFVQRLRTVLDGIG